MSRVSAANQPKLHYHCRKPDYAVKVRALPSSEYIEMTSRIVTALTLYGFYAAEAFAQGANGKGKGSVPEFDGTASLAVLALVVCGAAILFSRSR